jgi:hypothetical protein
MFFRLSKRKKAILGILYHVFAFLAVVINKQIPCGFPFILYRGSH